jgi:hypothetical protein
MLLEPVRISMADMVSCLMLAFEATSVCDSFNFLRLARIATPRWSGILAENRCPLAGTERAIDAPCRSRETGVHSCPIAMDTP